MEIHTRINKLKISKNNIRYYKNRLINQRVPPVISIFSLKHNIFLLLRQFNVSI